MLVNLCAVRRSDSAKKVGLPCPQGSATAILQYLSKVESSIMVAFRIRVDFSFFNMKIDDLGVTMR